MGRRLSTHVLDARSGRPAAGVAVTLFRIHGDEAVRQAEGRTDGDGRIRELADALAPGTYRLAFEVGLYLRQSGGEGLFRRVLVDIEVTDEPRDYHVPLLVAPNACVAYRGS